MMLRECCRHEPLAKIMLYSEDFYNFFDYVELSTFDIASDAFSTFKVPMFTAIFAAIFIDLDRRFDYDLDVASAFRCLTELTPFHFRSF